MLDAGAVQALEGVIRPHPMPVKMGEYVCLVAEKGEIKPEIALAGVGVGVAAAGRVVKVFEPQAAGLAAGVQRRKDGLAPREYNVMRPTGGPPEEPPVRAGAWAAEASWAGRLDDDARRSG